MRNTKLYSILSQLTKYEQNRFRKYLQSPYFNVNQSLIDLFEIINDDINSTKTGELSKKLIWRILKPGGRFDDVRFRKYVSDLLKLAEGFLAQQLYEVNPIHQSTLLIKAVGNKKLDKLYNSTMKTARRITQKFPHRSADYFFHQYRIEKNYYNLTDFETKRDVKSNLEEILRNLDHFYFSEKLRFYCSALIRQRFSSHKYDFSFIPEMIRHIEENDYEDVPSILVYYQIHLLYTQPENEEHYFKLKELLAKHALLFPSEEARDDLYSHAINYCVSKINAGNPNFLKELFILYKELVEREIIFANGELSPWNFKNIIVVALRLGEYAWAEEFVFNYSEYLPSSSRKNAVTFNLAQIYFYQKQYEKVIVLLQEVEFEDLAYNLNSKAMLIATYYEQDEIEPLYSLFDSFRVYLNRNKDIPESRRTHYKNLIKFTKKLTKIRPGDQLKIKKLKEEVDKTKNITSIGWLKEKITELDD